MSNANIIEYSSQSNPINPQVTWLIAGLNRLKTAIKSWFQPAFNPNSLTPKERHEAGILDCEVDWYNAAYGPLIK